MSPLEMKRHAIICASGLHTAVMQSAMLALRQRYEPDDIDEKESWIVGAGDATRTDWQRRREMMFTVNGRLLHFAFETKVELIARITLLCNDSLAWA